MNSKASALIASLAVCILPTAHAQTSPPLADPAALVNPFIGTANGGNVFPGATMPFGMVQFSPEASPVERPGHPKRPIAAPGGYEYSATRIRGFSLTNVEGWGCGGGSGDVPIMPVTVPIDKSPSLDFRTAYASGFSHAQEQAHPGYYQVLLANGVDVQLTASTHTGSAVFAFPAGKPETLLIRTSDSEVGSTDAHTRIDQKQQLVTGSVTSGNFCGYIGEIDRRAYYTLYFAVSFDQPIDTTGAWHDGTVSEGAGTADGGTGFGRGFPDKGKGSGVWVSFKPSVHQTVNMRVGISYVSLANAEANLKAENPAKTDFKTIRDKANTAWNKRLNQIAITGGTKDERTVFTTALYHSLMTPTTFSDVNGEYRGMDGNPHHISKGQYTQYANFSGWDVYRSQLQLVTWLDPVVGSDIARSLYNQSQQNGGAWDRWTHQSGATHVMNGDPSPPALADIWAFNGRDFDAKAALASLVKAADTPTAADLSHDGCPVECGGQRPGLDQYLKLHYIPVGAPAWGPAADTLEDATAEFGISALAGRLGEKEIQHRFLKRAQYWRNIFNPKAAPEGGYFQNRNADGSWALVRDEHDSKPHAFTPSTGDGFVEGSAAQYVWMVPFNEAGLFKAMGGTAKASARLDRFFYNEKGEPAVTNAGPLHAELNNEPSIETPWLYDFAGQPWKTQQLVRQVLNTIWTNTPSGIPGNDDLGEMSSWAVFASLGLYPEIPGRAEFLLGSPRFPKIVVHRPGGEIAISAGGGGTDAPYVKSLRVNGSASTRTWLPESFALQGGTLDFELSATPNKQWGTGADDRPPSFNAE